MRSAILPPGRFEPEDYSTPTLTEPASSNLLAQVIRHGNMSTAADLEIGKYTPGLLNSYSIYAHTYGLNFSMEKSLSQLFEDIEHYEIEPYLGADFAGYELLTDEVRLAETQVWTRRTYTLGQTPDSSLPHFPEEDFEG
jgi:hypothetical protein